MWHSQSKDKPAHSCPFQMGVMRSNHLCNNSSSFLCTQVVLSQWSMVWINQTFCLIHRPYPRLLIFKTLIYGCIGHFTSFDLKETAWGMHIYRWGCLPARLSVTIWFIPPLNHQPWGIPKCINIVVCKGFGLGSGPRQACGIFRQPHGLFSPSFDSRESHFVDSGVENSIPPMWKFR